MALKATLGLPSTFTFTARDLEGFPIDHNDGSFSTSILGGGTASTAIIQYAGEGNFSVSVTPATLGNMSLLLSLGDIVFAHVSLVAGCPVALAPLSRSECACPAGAEPAAGGACSLCQRSRYKPAVGNLACQPCGAVHLTTHRQGSTSRQECGCEIDFYRHDDESPCKPAPHGATCPSVNTTLASLSVAPGFWRLTGRGDELTQCGPNPAESSCQGGIGFADALCRNGSSGPWCRVCPDSFFFDFGRQLCLECPSAGNASMSFLLLFIVIAVVVGGCVYVIPRLKHLSWFGYVYTVLAVPGLFSKFKVSNRLIRTTVVSVVRD